MTLPDRAPWPPAALRIKRRQACAGLAAATLPAVHVSGWAQGPDGTAADADEPIIKKVAAGAAQIELQFAPGFDARLRAEALAWVQRSAKAVIGYFGRFPVPSVELLLSPTDGAGVRSGATYAGANLFVRVRVGRETSTAQFLDDWILVHEMVHLAIPRVPRAQNWLHEGLATYVESVARGRAGLVPAGAVWREWSRDMPQGQPQRGDAGLDHTPTWGRTYWGGAIFCLLADVQMLTLSERRMGLQQALQGVLAAGGHYGVAWPVELILTTADAAVGQSTLADLYRRMKDSPEPAALNELWRKLGVNGDQLDNRAPLAAVRRAILA